MKHTYLNYIKISSLKNSRGGFCIKYKLHISLIRSQAHLSPHNNIYYVFYVVSSVKSNFLYCVNINSKYLTNLYVHCVAILQTSVCYLLKVPLFLLQMKSRRSLNLVLLISIDIIARHDSSKVQTAIIDNLQSYSECWMP